MVNIIHRLSQMIICMNYKMLEYNIIDISEGTDVNKRNTSKECDI